MTGRIAELSRRGYVASITLRNTRGIDVLASNTDATKSVGIQVKTCQGSKPDWMMNRKAEADLAQNLFYVFVCLPAAGEPTFYVVPRSDVAKYVRDSHQKWLGTPGRKGQLHATPTCVASRTLTASTRGAGISSASINR